MELSEQLKKLLQDVKDTVMDDKYNLDELEDGFIRSIEHAEALESKNQPPLSEGGVDKICDNIKDALMSHNLRHFEDEDGGSYSLVDRLTPDNEDTITKGSLEIDYIIDTIYDVLSTSTQVEENKGEWVSVEDGFPERQTKGNRYSIWVHTWDKNGNDDKSVYDYDTKLFYNEGEDWPDRNVTHWKAILPPNPTKEE